MGFENVRNASTNKTACGLSADISTDKMPLGVDAEAPQRLQTHQYQGHSRFIKNLQWLSRPTHKQMNVLFCGTESICLNGQNSTRHSLKKVRSKAKVKCTAKNEI